MTRYLSLVFVVLLAVGSLARADDWPNWRGADRTDVSRETGLLREWSEGGPQRLWLFEQAGAGYSGPAIVNQRLFTMGTRDKQTILMALDANTGTELWTTPMGSVLKNNWGNGPRATPTVSNGLVYAMTGEGDLVCARAEDGALVWQRNMDDFQGHIPRWGYSESVLVHEGRVICTPGGDGGIMIALAAKTGDLIWETEELPGTVQYSSPIFAEHNGVGQYIQLTKFFVCGVSPQDGEVLWQSEWPGRTAVVPTPIFDDGLAYVTSGYGVGCKLISLRGNKPQDEYSNKVMKNHHGGVILLDGYLYGYSNDTGWVCQEFATGEMVWRERDKLGKGCIAYADERLYCVDEREGNVVLIEASPEGWKEHGRFQLDPQTKIRKRSGGIWTHPVIANGKLYLRDQNLIYCYDIAGG